MRRARVRPPAACGRSRPSTACPISRWARARTGASPSRRARRSSGSAPFCGRVNIREGMSFSNVWNRTLVYFGIAEEEEDWDEDGFATNEELERSYQTRERANVRRLAPRRQRE